jgi:hypothetical protein
MAQAAEQAAEQAAAGDAEKARNQRTWTLKTLPSSKISQVL